MEIKEFIGNIKADIPEWKNIKVSKAFYERIRMDGFELDSLEDHEADITNIDPMSFETIRKEFLRIKTQIEEALNYFGILFIKMEGKACRDMIGWLPRLRVHKAESFLLMMKYSDDWGFNYDSNSRHNNRHLIEFTLKQWKDYHPALEIRCLIDQRRLLKISQRNRDKFYPYLKQLYQDCEETLKSILVKLVSKLEDANCLLIRDHRPRDQ